MPRPTRQHFFRSTPYVTVATHLLSSAKNQMRCHSLRFLFPPPCLDTPDFRFMRMEVCTRPPMCGLLKQRDARLLQSALRSKSCVGLADLHGAGQSISVATGTCARCSPHAWRQRSRRQSERPRARQRGRRAQSEFAPQGSGESGRGPRRSLAIRTPRRADGAGAGRRAFALGFVRAPAAHPRRRSGPQGRGSPQSPGPGTSIIIIIIIIIIINNINTSFIVVIIDINNIISFIIIDIIIINIIVLGSSGQPRRRDKPRAVRWSEDRAKNQAVFTSLRHAVCLYVV